MFVEFRKYFLQANMGRIVVALVGAVAVATMWMQIAGNAPIMGIFAPLLVFGVLLILLSSLHVGIAIGDQLSIRLFPFPARKISFDEIVSVEVAQYRPIRDYGGWGLKWGKNGTAYTIGGKIGVKVELKNGKHVMLDSRAPAALRDAIEVARG